MLRKTIAALLAATALGAATSASAANIETLPCKSGPAGCYFIGIFGEIKEGDGDQFVKVVADKRVTEAAVLLNSPGGNFLAGLQIGREIKRLNFTTYVADKSLCASACGYIWLAGSVRLYDDGARIGFHAPFNVVKGKGKSVTAYSSTAGSALAGAYLSQIGMTDKAVYFLTMAPPSQMLWLTTDIAQKLDISVRKAVKENNKTILPTASSTWCSTCAPGNRNLPTISTGDDPSSKRAWEEAMHGKKGDKLQPTPNFE
jgi:hypothetical protein